MFLKRVIWVVASIFLLGLSSIYTTVQAVVRGPDLNLPGKDYTIYRTVNNLSCHPQNPLLPDVPNYVAYDAEKSFDTANGVTGYCVAFHYEGNGMYIGVQGGSTLALRDRRTNPAPVVNVTRPSIPWRHYVVMEFPNPCYVNPSNPAATPSSCSAETKATYTGKYIHYEGTENIYIIGYGSGDLCSSNEVWHMKNSLSTGGAGVGGMKISEDSVDQMRSYWFNNNTLCGAALTTTSGYTFSTYGGGGVRRVGDKSTSGQEILPNVVYGTGVVSGYTLNPTFYTDIPHDRFAQLTNPNDRSWVKCSSSLPQDYFTVNIGADGHSGTGFGSDNPPQVFPVAPTSCEYPSLIGNPKNDPVCLNTSYQSGVRIPTSLEGCAGPQPSVTPSPTASVTPTASPTPTASITPTTTTPGDTNGDHIVNIVDYRAVITNFGQSGSAVGALQGDVTGDHKVNLFDYTIVVSNFRP